MYKMRFEWVEPVTDNQDEFINSFFKNAKLILAYCLHQLLSCINEQTVGY